jgi:hypothetical protein
MQNTFLGMPFGEFLVCVAIAVGLLFLYTPKGVETNKGSLVSTFLVVIAVAVVMWPVIGPWLSGLFYVAYGVK